jgi:hypothetical protein
MQVKTQPFKEAIEIKSDGIIFDVYGNGSKRLGDLSVTRTGLVWCKGANGKMPRGKGINVKWEDFITWVQSQQAATRNGMAAKTGARNGGLPKLASAKLPEGKAKSKTLTAAAKKPAIAGSKTAGGSNRARKAN